MPKEKEETNPIKDNSNPCAGCSLCCRYIALEIDTPEDEEDWDNIYWYLLHQNVWVWIDNDDSWNLQFNTPCEKLTKEGWCGIYDERPNLCKRYSSENCEKYGDGKSYKLLFKNAEEFQKWFKSGKKIPKE
jgi:Fe-S-cluster containining protein